MILSNFCVHFNEFDIIHYFKGTASNILRHFLIYLNKKRINLPIITTVCQRPSYKSLILSPYEIKKTDYFVLIDMASYNDDILNFIPINKKCQIYFSNSDDINKTESIEYVNRNDNRIIFGRGTTLSKCPKDMFDIFDKINVKNKELHIVGVPKGDNWVYEEAQKRDNVIMYGILSFEEWFNTCKMFDIVLYQLPLDSHASIDANLGLAMNMRKPVIYMGSEAPKERFVHGVNGYIANNASEMIEYAEKLANDYNLRKSIGERAREYVCEKFSPIKMVKLYVNAYIETINNFKTKNALNIPVGYYIKYLSWCYKRIIQEMFNYYPNVKKHQSK